MKNKTIYTRESLNALSKEELVEIILLLSDRILALEKNSSTSSKPPSSDMTPSPRPYPSREISGKKPGGQPGRKGIAKIQTETPDTIITLHPKNCRSCQQSLEHVPEEETGIIRQVGEIPEIQLFITEYRQPVIVCPKCHARNTEPFPENVTASFQYGSRVKSMLAYLHVAQKLPFERLTKLIHDLLNISVSEGTLENCLAEAGEKSRPLQESIRKEIQKQPWLGSDETGTHVNGKKWWEWVWQNSVGALYVCAKSRGFSVVTEYFGETYAGVILHDCWSAQNKTIAKGHQLCHAHLLRELRFFVETERNLWAYQMMVLLRKTHRARDRVWKEGFPSHIRTRVIASYEARLDRLLVQSDIRSRNRKIETLRKRFVKHREKILFFLGTENIPFHNNSSEQAIRNAKIHQKISGGFRSEAGAIRYASILSVIETCRRRNMDILSSLNEMFLGRLSFETVENGEGGE